MKRDYAWAKENGLKIIDPEKLYDDMLDEVYGQVNIAGLNYMTSRVQKEIDETAYACGVNDYLDGLLNDGEYTELEDNTIVITEEYDEVTENEENE